MSTRHATHLFLILGGLLLLLGGVSLAKGNLFITQYEGDTLHLMEIVLRMAQGELIHHDFMTPIGALAFWPIVWFVQAGFGMGSAFIWSQILIAVACLPAIWWAARSRMQLGLGVVFGGACLVLILALLHGGVDASTSVSMHYNRWAWAAAFVAIALAVLRPIGAKNSVADGVIIGVMMAILLMIKVTYFAAFAPGIIVALLARKDVKALVVALVTGSAIMAALTLWLGVSFWAAYLLDLLAVAGSEIRSAPGADFGDVIGAPAYVAGSMAGLSGVIFLRQGGRLPEGLALLVLLPGFFYVTYQNFGNDPKWLMLLGVLLWAAMPEMGAKNDRGWDMRWAMQMVAIASFVLIVPIYFNMTYSPVRNLTATLEDFTPVLSGNEQHADLKTAKLRAQRVDVSRPFDREGQPFAALADAEHREDVTEFMGEALPECSIETGLPSFFQTIAGDLEDAGYGQARIMTADLFNSYWMFGDFKPTQGGAPWYYGDLPGYETAEYLMVPLCAVLPAVRDEILGNVTEAGTDGLREVRRTETYILFDKR